MLLQLLRIQQWYKNIIVFLPLVFAGLITNGFDMFLTVLGFLALCCMSSVNYILNDILDREKDRIHPEKKIRPIASGKVSIVGAGAIAALLAIVSLTIAIMLSPVFFSLVLLFFFLTQAYSLYFKKELFVDIIFISVNFVLRAISGAYILDVRISPWLIVCTFFLSLFIVLGKRKADLIFLGKDAEKHKESLALYSPQITNTLMIIATVSLLLSYVLYSFLSIYPLLVYSVPFALYVILRYFFLVETNSPIARKPELFYKDTRLVLGIALWICAVLLLMYIF